MADIPGMVKFNADGLVPVIAQDARTDEVLMLAYMNEESLKETIRTGYVHYYSRSRQKLWLKGETSGHYQKVRNISIDCDGDALLIKVEQTGAACHTGHHSCFFTKFDPPGPGEGTDTAGITGSPGGNAADAWKDTAAADAEKCGNAMDAGPDGGTAAQEAPAGGACSSGGTAAGPGILTEVFGVILDRKANPKEGSYTNYLFTKGLDKILKKIAEEAGEVMIAAKNGSPSEIQAEVADLFYHVMVLLAERGMTLSDVFDELKKRT